MKGKMLVNEAGYKISQIVELVFFRDLTPMQVKSSTDFPHIWYGDELFVKVLISKDENEYRYLYNSEVELLEG